MAKFKEEESTIDADEEIVQAVKEIAKYLRLEISDASINKLASYLNSRGFVFYDLIRKEIAEPDFSSYYLFIKDTSDGYISAIYRNTYGDYLYVFKYENGKLVDALRW